MPMLLIMRRNAYTIDCNRSHFLIPFALLFQSPNFKLFDTICSVFKQTLNCLEDILKVLDCHLALVCHKRDALDAVRGGIPRPVCDRISELQLENSTVRATDITIIKYI